ncbi:phage tail protein [Paraferrimonas sp. SM1919]|uniref:phage tail protein n=1 Tax=Paraferrimonas sp. SM1919 TaxID=2662263 RepID=UPI0013D5C691|nr:tail fiber protein [Paraferrimonas sp. SM1919]
MTEPYIGQIQAFGFNFPPKNWALCNGQLLDINSHQALFSLIGTTFGGDGRTNFAVPDLRGRVPIGMSPTLPQGTKAGFEEVTLSLAELGSHNHPFKGDPGLGAKGNAGSSKNRLLADSQEPLYGAPNNLVSLVDTSTNGANQAGGGSHQNMQPTQVINYAISLTGEYPPRN